MLNQCDSTNLYHLILSSDSSYPMRDLQKERRTNPFRPSNPANRRAVPRRASSKQRWWPSSALRMNKKRCLGAKRMSRLKSQSWSVFECLTCLKATHTPVAELFGHSTSNGTREFFDWLAPKLSLGILTLFLPSVPNFNRRFLRAVTESNAETQNNNTNTVRAWSLKFFWNHDRPLQAGCLSSPQQKSCHKRVRIVLSGAAGFNIIIWADLEALTVVRQHGNQMLFVCLTDSRRFICCAQFCYFQWISGLQSIRFPLQFLFP